MEYNDQNEHQIEYWNLPTLTSNFNLSEKDSLNT